jgi:hypothetical protein
LRVSEFYGVLKVQAEVGSYLTTILKWFPQAPMAHACNSSYWRAEMRRIMVQSQPEQIVCRTLRKKPSQKRADGVD